MVKTFKFLMAILLVSFGATVSAQCIPMNAPGPPRLWDGARGCYVPQGTPDVNSGYGGFSANQLTFQPVQAQPQRNIPQGCYIVKKAFWDRVKDGAGEGALTGIVAGLLGAAIDRDRGTGGRFTDVGLSAGAAIGLGSTLANDSTVVCPAQQQQVVQVQQQVPQRICPQGTSWKVLNWPGHPQNGTPACLPSDAQIEQDKQAFAASH